MAIRIIKTVTRKGKDRIRYVSTGHNGGHTQPIQDARGKAGFKVWQKEQGKEAG